MSSQKFYLCKHCGNLVELIHNSGSPLVCCGEKMQELIPNTVEAATEKHIPEVTISGDLVSVKVGSVTHPMTEEHHITFIYLHTRNGRQRKCLNIGAEPMATFKLVDDVLLEAYAYCNLHGLWKYQVE